MQHFQPPGNTSGCQVRHLPKSVTLGQVGEKTPYNMVELTSDGRVFMARNLAYGRDTICGFNFGQTIDPAKRWIMPMNNYQPQFIEAVQQYLAGLVAFGVQGPWFLSLSVLKMKNGILVPSYDWHWLTELGQTWFGDDMHADTIVIPADLDLASEQALTDVLKQPLKEIWRHNSHKGMPVFDGQDVRWEK